MQKILDLFSKACSDLGLTISLDKTVAMFSPPPGLPYIEPNLFVYGKRLKVVLELYIRAASCTNRVLLTMKPLTESVGPLHLFLVCVSGAGQEGVFH